MLFKKHINMDECPLLGEKVYRVFVSPGEEELYFDVGKDISIMFDTDADCCSETWFADITSVKQLIGGLVSKVEEVDVKHVGCDNRSRQEDDCVYGYKITTNLGVCSIVYRNSSNGYYGGGCEIKTIDTPIPDNCVEITNDWSS